MESIFVYGAGGQGRVVVDTLKNGRVEYGLTAVIDDDSALKGRTVMGYPIRGNGSINRERGVIAIGDNEARVRIASRYRGRLVTLVHRTAFLAQDVPVGEGTVLMAGSVVNVGSKIGANVIINTGSTIDHDCEIEDGVHIAPGCHLCGDVFVGERSLLGAGTIVVPGVHIGRNVFIHAGQTIVRDVPDGATVRSSR